MKIFKQKKRQARSRKRNRKGWIQYQGDHSRLSRLAFMMNRPKEMTLKMTLNSLYGKYMSNGVVKLEFRPTSSIGAKDD